MKIDQFLPTLNSKDAIGNETILIQALLRKWGYESEIFAERGDKTNRAEYKHISRHRKSDVIIYHHSIGANTANIVKNKKAKKILMYHNITPDYYFWDVNAELASLSSLGRQQLEELKNDFELALADSEYNRQELDQAGYANTHVLPLLIDFSKQ